VIVICAGFAINLRGSASSYDSLMIEGSTQPRRRGGGWRVLWAPYLMGGSGTAHPINRARRRAGWTFRPYGATHHREAHVIRAIRERCPLSACGIRFSHFS